LRFYLDYNGSFTGDEVPQVYQKIKDQKVFHVSAKQIPSACTLRKTGSPTVISQSDVLHEAGFPIRETSYMKLGNRKFNIQSQVSTPHPLTADVLGEFLDETSSDSGSYTTEPEEPSLEWKTKRTIAYQDPWLIFSYLSWLELKGLKPFEIRVWFADLRRIQDPLSPGLLGEKWKGSSSNRQRFEEIASLDVKLDFISKHTFWGYSLRNAMRGGPADLSAWATRQWKRLRRYLAGEADPDWPKAFRDRHFTNDPTGQRKKTRSIRLIEVLKTVDGMFCQRYLTFPQETWTWHKYDMFVLKNLFTLLADEFFDGELREETLEITTRYEELKAARGLFKFVSHSGTDLDNHLEGANLPEWLHQFIPLWKGVLAEPREFVKNAKIGVMSQTRGCGTPPSLVVLRTKRKFLSVVTEVKPPLSVLQKRLVVESVNGVVQSIPDHAFTGLETKSRITVTTSACWEYTQKEGGTVQAISDLVTLGSAGKPAQVFDLDTGLRTGEIFLQNSHPGEYIFWRCLEFVLGHQPEEISDVQMVAVKEPGKSRIVTKGSAYLKMVLDLVNKLCSEPIKKGLESSSSGMAESNHGWNFFRSFFEGPKEDLLFQTESETITEIQFTKNVFVDRKFKTVYVSSTDFETATDYMDLEVAQIAATLWMQRCGIPKVLRSIVQRFCYRPRKIVFHASGCLSNIGEVYNVEEKLRYVVLSRGIMMGDPLTKVVLHLVNASVRYMSSNFDKIEFLRKVFPTRFNLVAEEIHRTLGYQV